MPALSRRAAVATAALTCCAGAERLIDYVDTRIGTGGVGFGIGSLNPGAQVPYGALRLGPDTTPVIPGLGPAWFHFNHFGGYYAGDTHISAFSHTHMVGSGATDWGNFGFMPTRWLNDSACVNSADHLAGERFRSGWSHDNETATPGYYATWLTDAAAHAEVAAGGTHSGVHRYTCAPLTAAEDPSSPLPCILTMDVCHNTNDGNSCREASFSLTAAPSAAGGGSGAVAVLEASVLNSGGLTGRGPLGGVYVYLYAEVTAATGDGSPLAPSGGAQWEGVSTTPLLGPVPWPPSSSSLPPVNATTSGNAGAALVFTPPSPGDAVVITARVGLSFLSLAQARANLAADQTAAGGGGWQSVEAVIAATQDVWEAQLSRLSVTLPPAPVPPSLSASLTPLYSAAYRTFLSPTIYSETGGLYLGFDGVPHTLPSDGPLASFRSDMSIWDIHRSQAPWLTLADGQAATDVAGSLLLAFNQSGAIPRWPIANIDSHCMVGSHGVVMLADALTKGVSGLDAASAWAAASSTLHAQDSLNSRFAALGYIPSEDDSCAASVTLEYAYDDAAGAVLAAAAGDESAAAVLAARSKAAWRAVFVANVTQMCARSAVTNTTHCPWDPSEPYPLSNSYTEGDALQYQTFVPHDQAGLVAAFPSPAAFADALETLQAKQTEWPFGNDLPNPYYWAGNEPDILSPWQFGAAGPEWAYRTAFWTRWNAVTYYLPGGFAGIPGNDDYGTMSAWFLWAQLGLYPVSAEGVYAVGSPFYPQATVSGPRTLTITAHGWSENATYVSKATANGVVVPTPFVSHDALFPPGAADDGAAPACGEAGAKPCTLELWMTTEPVVWGSDPAIPVASLHDVHPRYFSPPTAAAAAAAARR